MTFLERKKQFFEKLNRAKIEKKVDSEIIDTLNLINSSENYYTTSSCSGRTILIEVIAPSLKKDAKFVLKSHKEISLFKLKEGIQKHEKNQLWLMAEPPILHIGAKDLKAAKKILDIAYLSGFKRSNIKSIGTKIIVEIMSSEEMHVPLACDKTILVDDKYLEYVVNLSNTILAKGKMRLKRLDEKLREEIKAE